MGDCPVFEVNDWACLCIFQTERGRARFASRTGAGVRRLRGHWISTARLIGFPTAGFIGFPQQALLSSNLCQAGCVFAEDRSYRNAFLTQILVTAENFGYECCRTCRQSYHRSGGIGHHYRNPQSRQNIQRFLGRPKVQALEALDIEVRRGEIFGLLGPNGSGKSTTIKLIQGLLFPSSGRAFVFGKDARDVSKNERIGYLPEESYLYKFLNAEETLDFYGRLFDMPADVRKQRTDELIQMVGLKGARRQQLREYSKGMTRRIGLAQALINQPDLLILDEPTSGLDPIGSREMKDLILRLRDEGKTILMCSHQLADVQDVCDRIAILHRGRLRELGRVNDLLKVREVTEVHAKGLSAATQTKIAELIKADGGEVLSIDNPTTTMEELFLEIVRESEARPGMRTSASAQASNK